MVWILLGTGLLLVIFNVRAIMKEKNSFKNVFNNTEQDMKEFDFKLSELRREFSETILELQKEIVEVKESYETHNNIYEVTKDMEENKVGYYSEILNDDKENGKEILNNDKEYRINNDNEYNSKILFNEKENRNCNINKNEEHNSDNLDENEENNKDNFNNNNEKNPNDMLDAEVKDEKNEMNNNIKIGEINRLLALGLSIEEISEKLGIGRGEVLLIKELYLR